MDVVMERRGAAPAREAAYRILERVMTTAAHSDELLHAPAVSALSAADRNLATALVMGVLRWQIALDAELLPLLERPDTEIHPAALIALRLGLFQLAHLERIPAHAAIHESVELAREHGAPHAAGMVNALLRRWGRARAAGGALRETLAAVSPAERAHPAWLLRRWRANYGGKQTRLLCGYDQEEPPQHGLFRASGESLPAIDDGSRMIAELAAGSAPDAAAVLDCCAAPGGKTLVLAGRLAEAEIVAADVSERRLSAMERRLKQDQAGERVQVVLADMTEQHVDGSAALLRGRFDLVLCDAPCSGTGTLARNPEIRHRLREGDLQRQAERQRALLRNALRRLKPGGRVVYSTCSMEPEENEQVVSAVLSEGGVRAVSLKPVLADVQGMDGDTQEHLNATAITSDGFLRTVPGVHAADGFFAAVLERV